MKLYLCVAVILVAIHEAWTEELYPNMVCHTAFDNVIGRKNIGHFKKFCSDNKHKFPCFKICIMHLSGIIVKSGSGVNKQFKQQAHKMITKGFERYFFDETPKGKEGANDMAKKIHDACPNLLTEANKSSKKEEGVNCEDKTWLAYFDCVDKIWNCP